MLSRALTVALLALPALSLPDPVHIPIHRRAPQIHDAAYYSRVADNIRAKYNLTTQNTPSRRMRKRGSAVGIQVTDQVSVAIALLFPYPFIQCDVG